MRELVAFAVLCFLLAAGQMTSAQSVQGVVAGTIFDCTGGGLPGATVTLTNILKVVVGILYMVVRPWSLFLLNLSSLFVSIA